jgi:hypothetical protein
VEEGVVGGLIEIGGGSHLSEKEIHNVTLQEEVVKLEMIDEER